MNPFTSILSVINYVDWELWADLVWNMQKKNRRPWSVLTYSDDGAIHQIRFLYYELLWVSIIGISYEENAKEWKVYETLLDRKMLTDSTNLHNTHFIWCLGSCWDGMLNVEIPALSTCYWRGHDQDLEPFDSPARLSKCQYCLCLTCNTTYYWCWQKEHVEPEILLK